MTDYLKIPWEAGDYPAGLPDAAEIRLNPKGIKPFVRVLTNNSPGLDAYELVKHIVALHNAALEEKRP